MRTNRNMRIGAFIAAVALILIGLVYVVRGLLNRAQTSPPVVAQTTENGETIPVAPTSAFRIAVAREDIPERSIVTMDMLKMVDARAGMEPGPFVTDPGVQAIGFITARPIASGTSLRQADFVGHISEVGIAGALQPGLRAMVIPLTNRNTLHELVRVGDRIDIVASFDQAEARTVVQNVRVLAVDVFGKDYPQVKVAMRGDYKASARSIDTANPSSPSAAPVAATSPDAPAGSAPAPTVVPVPGAAPTPAPTDGPPPPRPEPALTIEVSPEQAAAIALTQAAGQNIDFLLRPRNEPGVPSNADISGDNAGDVRLADGEATVRAASITRPQLAPYSARLKNPAPAKSSATSSNSGNGIRNVSSGAASRPSRSSRGGGVNYVGPPTIPSPESGGSRDVPIIPPANVEKMSPPPPTTYDIPVYGDGKLVRTDTVKKPRE